MIFNETKILLACQLILAWNLANYGFVNEPYGKLRQQVYQFSSYDWTILSTRAIAAGVVAFLLPGSETPWIAERTLLALVIGTLVFALPLVRRSLAQSLTKHIYLAEVELVANTVFYGFIWVIIAYSDVSISGPLIPIPIQNTTLSAGLIIVSGLLFVVRGGTHIVRGVLDKSGLFPSSENKDAKVDETEFNRGRLIGSLERVALFLVLLAGSYEAVGFLLAAKGFIRARELDKSKGFAEYVLVGTLVSVLVALVIGIAANRAIHFLSHLSKAG